MLSPRVVHYASKELNWEYLEENWCHCHPPSTMNTAASSREHVYHLLLATEEAQFTRRTINLCLSHHRIELGWHGIVKLKNTIDLI